MSTPVQYSHSSISTFQACPLRYYFRYVLGLQARDAESNTHHLAWGAALHAGLEAIYEAQQFEQQSSENETIINTLTTAQEIFRAEYPTQLDPLDRAKTQENGIRALALYVQRWAEEDRNWRVLEVEGPGTGQALASGLNELHTDLIVENTAHGGIYIVDHKTTGKALGGSGYWDQFEPNSQITHYIDYTEQKFGSCEGFIINAISLQWRDEKKANNANNVALFELDDPAMPWLAYSHHEQRYIKGNKARDMMAAWGLTVAFERRVFNRSQQQVRQERESTNYWINQIESTSSECGPGYGFNTGACYSCDYRGGELVGGICRPGHEWPKDRELILLNYRRVCRQIIAVTCPACGGNGIEASCRKLLAELVASDKQWSEWPSYTINLTVCPTCKGTRTVDGPRCVLDLDHVEACSALLPAPLDSGIDEIQIEVSI